ncbi:GntR family transcriptional regulator [Cerasicoccus arenae]|uniref:GntR family transcriptional regulator n=1 Tax=Cerasicoccus arenae TaxID=424488 RepID=A0A8J3GDI2_9BACT|nr:GntR family transcriptional regulator [Cerasicoccus arenae]
MNLTGEVGRKTDNEAMQSKLDVQNMNEATRYQAARTLIKRMVLSGEVGHNQQLQPELEICRETNLSRTTVRKAISDLVNEGLLVRYRGRGTFVNISRTSSQKKLLALLCCQYPNVSGAYNLLIQGAQEAASRLGYQLLLANDYNETEAALEQAMHLNELRVAGTIIVPLQTPTSNNPTSRIIRALRQAGQQVVLLDENSSDDELVSVVSQNRESMRELTMHLVQRGYRRIAFLTGTKTQEVAEREMGFRQAMEEKGLEVPPEYFLEVAGRDPASQGRQEIDVFMAMRTPPEAIVCLHDLIALNAMGRCAERGWRVPQDIAIVGFDDLPQAQMSSPPLTSVHQPLREEGKRALELLVELLNGKKLVGHHERLPCRLVVRDSCGSTLPQKT